MPSARRQLGRLIFADRAGAARGKLRYVSRRTAMRLGGAGLATLATPARGAAAKPQRIAVVGAGLAGLTAASTLQAGGAEVVVYEARRRPGGRVHSIAAPFADELVLDLGASLINSDHAEVLALVDELGLELFAQQLVPTGPMPVDAFLFGGQWLRPRALAAALEPLALAIERDAAHLDEDWQAHLKRLDGRSVADYVAAIEGGDGALREAVIAAAMRGEYGVDAAEASALELIWLAPRVDGDAVTLLGSSDEAFTIKGGAGRLPQALADRLGPVVRYGAVVERIVDEGPSAVQIGLADGTSEAFDAAIIAIPPAALRRLELRGDLPLRFVDMTRIGRLGRNEKLFTGFTGRPWSRAGRFSSGVWTDQGFCTAWWATERQPEATAAGFVFFYGGSEVEALADRVEADAGRAVSLLGEAVPGLTDARLPGALRTNWSRDAYAGGSYASFEPRFYSHYGDFLWYEADGGATSGPAFGRLAFAGEHLSDAYYGYMNGAIETGRLAAATLLEGLGG